MTMVDKSRKTQRLPRHTQRLSRTAEPQEPPKPVIPGGSGGACFYHDQFAGWTVRVSILVIALPWFAALVAPDRVGAWVPLGLSIVGILMAAHGLWVGSIPPASRRGADVVTAPIIAAAIGFVLFGEFAYMAGYASREQVRVKEEIAKAGPVAPERHAALAQRSEEARTGRILWESLATVMLASAVIAFAVALLGYLPRRRRGLCGCA
jgi:hypothetical protein